MFFLIEYDRRDGKLVALQEFDSSKRKVAEELRLQKELEQRLSPRQHEIVILEADSQAALRRTHRRYFEDFATLTGGLSSASLPLATPLTKY